MVLFFCLQVPLVIDKKSTKFNEILVRSKDLHVLIKKAGASLMPAVILLNGAIDFVFAKEELAEAGGMGKRKNNKAPLDYAKVEAAQVMSACSYWLINISHKVNLSDQLEPFLFYK